LNQFKAKTILKPFCWCTVEIIIASSNLSKKREKQN